MRVRKRTGVFFPSSLAAQHSLRKPSASGYSARGLVADGPVWFQLYVYRDRAATAALVERVEAAGCSAIELTVDAPVLGQRERDVRNSFALPSGLWAPNLPAEASRQRAGMQEGSELAATFAAMIDPSLSWDDVAWLQSITRLPIVIKGVVRADDAALAVQAGAAAISRPQKRGSRRAPGGGRGPCQRVRSSP